MLETKILSRSARRDAAPAYRLRRSPIHGNGVFATRTIKKGTRIIEYVGERISHAEADRRYAKKEHDDNHTFLFTVDETTVIDAGVRGNVARFINHSCDPNCEATIEDDRIFIEAIRTIAPGEELSYDYSIGRSPEDPPDAAEIFGCRCGTARCRGTMLAPLEEEGPKPRRRKTARRLRANRRPSKRSRRTTRPRRS